MLSLLFKTKIWLVALEFPRPMPRRTLCKIQTRFSSCSRMATYSLRFTRKRRAWRARAPTPTTLEEMRREPFLHRNNQKQLDGWKVDLLQFRLCYKHVHVQV